MVGFNSRKTTLITSIVVTIAILYTVSYDINQLGIKPDLLYLVVKSFFIIFSIPLFYFFKKIEIDTKVYFYGMMWSLYSIWFTYKYSINYAMSSVQVAILFTSILFLNRKHFLIMFSILTFGTAWAIHASQSPYGFSTLSTEFKNIYLDDFISMQLITLIAYYFVNYPRVKKLQEELKFSHFGKASTFVIHEMQKPLNRLLSKDEKNTDLDSIKKTLDIARTLQKGSVESATIIEVSADDLHRDILAKYSDYLSYYSIQTSTDFKLKTFKTDKALMEIVYDNLIRNAIEANKENPEDKRWIKVAAEDNSLFITNPYVQTLNEKELFTPLKTTKFGNMGIGLHFCKTILEGLGKEIRIDTRNNQFMVEISLRR